MEIRTAADAHSALNVYTEWVGSLPDRTGCPSYFNPHWHGSGPMHAYVPAPTVPVEYDPPLDGNQPREEPPFDWVLSSLQKWSEPGALVYVLDAAKGTDPQRVTTFRPWASVERRNRVGKWLLTASGPYGVRITDPLQQLVDWVADLDRLTALAARCASCARSSEAAGNPAAGSALDREAEQLQAFRSERESALLPTVATAFVAWWADLRATQAVSNRSRPAYRAATLR